MPGEIISVPFLSQTEDMDKYLLEYRSLKLIRQSSDSFQPRNAPPHQSNYHSHYNHMKYNNTGSYYYNGNTHNQANLQPMNRSIPSSSYGTYSQNRPNDVPFMNTQKKHNRFNTNNSVNQQKYKQYSQYPSNPVITAHLKQTYPQLYYNSSVNNNNNNNNNNNSSISISNIGEQQKFTSPQHIVHKAKFLSNAADSEYSILSNIIYQDTLSNKIPIDILYSNTNSASNSTIGNSSNNSPTGTNTSPEETEMEKIRQLYSEQRANIASHPYPSSNQNVYSILLGTSSAQIVASQVNLFANHFPLVPVEPPDGSLNFKRLLPRDPSEKGSQINWDASINQYYLNSEVVTFPELAIPLKKKQNHLVSVSLESCSPDATNIKSNVEWEHSLRYSTPMEIYTSINAPFSHTPGFHHLLVYLKHRFNQQDLVKMCRSIAEFRPIFIACSVTLTEEDMIFMEQCYQRTLLEYVKFIGQIGTPTCIWRRNGQISYVNEEFEILSGWTREELLNKMTFIVEIMDDESVRDYFTTLSKVAYKDFKGSEKMKVCRLLSPIRGKVIQCCCMWTLKRDVSGLPLMILGNFMPILN